jgi:hypothetical protein
MPGLGSVGTQSDYGDVDEDMLLEKTVEAERESAKKKSRASPFANIPSWARLACPPKLQLEDFDDSPGVGNSKQEKYDRHVRMRKGGRPTTPEWIEVDKGHWHKYAKFSDFGFGPLTLSDWVLPQYKGA